MNSKPHWPITELLPHKDNMMLLGALVYYDENKVIVSTTIAKEGVFTVDGDFAPAWLGVELMSQAIATYAGVQQRLVNQEPRVGFLLGTRRYVAHVATFAVGTSLLISAEKVYLDDSGLGAFQCQIYNDDRVFAESTINVYEPQDVEAYLKANQSNGSDQGEMS